jgi:hypothetical protein
MKICEMCKKEHNISFGSGRFCSLNCSKKFSTFFKRKEINEKVSKKLIKYEKKYCKKCFKKLSYKNKTGFCFKCLYNISGEIETNCNINCKICNIKLNRKTKTNICIKCYPNYNKNIKREAKIKKWLETGKFDTKFIPEGIKEYIIKEQNNKCKICGLEENWNNKKLVFVLDHIDGNCENNIVENLRAVCPNCDSQLSTFKSKNKNSKRVRDKEYRKKYNN